MSAVLGPQPATVNRATSTGSRLGIGGGRSGGAIYGSPGGSGPLIRAGVLVLAVIILLVLVAKNCTGSDGTADADFQETVATGVASIDPAIMVDFGDGQAVTLSGEVASEQLRLEAAQAAILAGATDVDNQLTVATGASFTSVDPQVAGALQTNIASLVDVAPITFASGSAELTDESKATLDQVAQIIKNSAGGIVDIVGHTDSQGQPETNLEISRNRANAVRVYLVEAGVDVLRVNSEGRGDAEPIADNDTEEGRAANRRIEFVVR